MRAMKTPRRPVLVAVWSLTVAAVAFAAATAAANPSDTAYLDQRIEREGVAMRVRLEPAASADPSQRSGESRAGRAGDRANARRKPADAAAGPRAGDTVRLSIELERLADAQPLSSLPIGAWLDHEVSVSSGAVPGCGQRVASILGGGLLQRPLVDLTGYYVLTLDAEGSVSVLDPAVQFAGRSSLYAAVQLGGRPFDWAKSGDDRWLFVALPQQREVVVIDLQELSLRQRIKLRGSPTRLALTPDGQQLWVAQRAQAFAANSANTAQAETTAQAQPASDTAPDSERVDVFAVGDGRALAGYPLPPGHHDIAFSDDSRYAYLGSRDSGRLSVIDNAGQRVLREVELGGQPLSLLYLPAQAQLWAIDGEQGVVHRLARDGSQIDRIALDAGLGPARLTPDGRHVLVVNPSQHRLYALAAADGELKHRLTVSGRPYDLFFSQRYAYVRPLDTEQVAMLSLASLDSEPTVQYLPTGAKAIGAFAGLPIASSMGDNMERAGAFFAAPGERTVYHYMEGMNAPDSGIRTFGHTPMAVTISRRGLREAGRGRYTTTFKVPSQGRMVLALASESPRLRECLAWQVAPAAVQADARGWSLRWLGLSNRRVRRGEQAEFALSLRAAPGRALPAASQLVAWIVSGAGGLSERWPLHATEHAGEYRIRGRLNQAGGYFVHVREVGGANSQPGDVPASLMVE